MTNHPPTALDAEVEARLAECRAGEVSRELLRDYLTGLAQTNAEIEIEPGHAKWAAIEISHAGRHIARVFSKRALVKLDSLVPGSKAGRYGPHVELNPRGEWSVFVADEDDVGVLLACTLDAIEHADAPRVRPSDLSSTGRKLLGDALRGGKGRPRLPTSLRFAVLYRDEFTCRYCGRSAPQVEVHVDHRTPVSRGGTNSMDNLVTACRDCNLGKSDRFVT